MPTLTITAAAPATEQTSLARWTGVIAMENTLTGDGRLIETDALRWADLPLPFRWARSEMGGHDGAVVVGHINTISRDGPRIRATGDFDLDSPDGREAARQVRRKLTRGISVDLDDADYQLRVAQDLMEQMDPDVEATRSAPDEQGRVVVMEVNSDDEVTVTSSARIRSATLLAIPAFAEAVIQLVDDPDPGETDDATLSAHLEAFQAGELPDGSPCSCDPDDDAFDEECVCQEQEEGEAAGSTGQYADRERVSNTPWGNFSASDYNDEQWRRATLIHRPAADGQDPNTKSLHSLPVREPSGVLNRNGVHAAAAALAGARGGLTGVTADQKRTAANRLITHYNRDLDETPPDNLYRIAGRTPPERSSAATVTAAAGPLAPPADWFTDPQLTGPSPLEITAAGRVYGHLACWDSCHTAFSGQCVSPPASPSGYAYFRTGSLTTREGTQIPVGHLTLNTVHAAKTASPAATLAHYENTGLAVADVAAGEDSFGIWVAGALRPGITEEQLRALRSSPLSGDWRRIGGHLELIAALAVNVPGFPIPRPQGLTASGQTVCLIASGMLAPRQLDRREAGGGQLSEEDLAWLRRLAARERVKALTTRLSAANLAGRVHKPFLAATATTVPGRKPDQGGQSKRDATVANRAAQTVAAAKPKPKPGPKAGRRVKGGAGKPRRSS